LALTARAGCCDLKAMPAADPESKKWFAEQVQPHEVVLRSHLRSVVGSLADVDDVAQESYRTLFKLRTGGKIRMPKARLFTVARKPARVLLRRKSSPSRLRSRKKLRQLLHFSAVAQ
jgi:DNA-directed RNA polymerase specialized sigma24 family protein